MKKLLVLVITAMMAISSAQAVGLFWVADYVSGDPAAVWSSPSSWWDGGTGFGVPTAGDTAYVMDIITGIQVPFQVIIQSDVSASVPDFLFVSWFDADTGTVNIVTGGSTAQNHVRLGNGIHAFATLNMNGGYMVSGILEVGYNLTNADIAVAAASAVVNMSGSSIIHAGNLWFGQESGHYGVLPLCDGEGVIHMEDSAWLLVNGDLTAATGDGRADTWVANDYVDANGVPGKSIAFIYNAVDARTEFTVIPEPATFGLIAILGLAFLRKK